MSQYGIISVYITQDVVLDTGSGGTLLTPPILGPTREACPAALFGAGARMGGQKRAQLESKEMP